MKKNTLIITFALLLVNLFFTNNVKAQNIYYTFANAEITNDGSYDYYEVDVQISADSDFKLGSGLLYFNYDTLAFDSNVKAKGNIEITYPEGSYLLGAVNFFSIYGNFVTNDNTTSRVAFSWQQALGSGAYAGDNVTATDANLFHIKIKFLDVNQDPAFCFESGDAFDEQTYTACGPNSFSIADCTNEPGIQMTSDSFNCESALLPIELLYFAAEPYDKEALLTWVTLSEINNSHFEVERSFDGTSFERIGIVAGEGRLNHQQSYDFIDPFPVMNENYYRLRQVDFDGRFTYTNIEVVRFKKDKVGTPIVSIFPNPTSQILTVNSDESGIESLQVFNSLGQMVLEQQTAASEYTNSLDVERLPSGVYYLKVNDSEQTVRFVKEEF